LAAKTPPSNGVSLGLSSGTLNAGGVIVDSGTTFISLDTPVFNALYNAIQSTCPESNLVGMCGETLQSGIFSKGFSLSQAQIDAYPTIQFKVSCTKGNCQTLDVPPSYWLYQFSGNFYTAGISAGSGTILGDVFMSPFHVVFDKSRGELGFASQSTCNLNGVAAGARLTSTLMDLLRIVMSLF